MNQPVGDQRLALVSTTDLIAELSRRSNAIALALVLPAANPNPSMPGPQVDSLFHTGGAYFMIEGLVSKLYRQAAHLSDQHAPMPNLQKQVPGITAPITFTLTPPRNS